jgi:hypothetical protein
MTRTIDPSLNPLEVLLVAEHYEKRGVEHYDLLPGNQCIWAARGSSSVPINEYFIFHSGKLVDIQID